MEETTTVRDALARNVTENYSFGKNVSIATFPSGAVLYSYGTPCAVMIFGTDSCYWYGETYSVTTKKHITKFAYRPKQVPQEEFLSALRQLFR